MRIVRRDSGSVVTWRRAQMVLLSAQGMDAAGIAKVVFTSEDRVRDVSGTSTPMGSARCIASIRVAIRRSSPWRSAATSKIAKSKLAEHGLPFSAWSLAKLTDYYMLNWSGRIDPDGNCYVFMHTGAPQSNSEWKNPEADKLLDDARLVTDMKQRMALYEKLTSSCSR